jgi:hypothetical protein
MILLTAIVLTMLFGQDRCGTAKDMVVRVRERLAGNLSAAENETLLQLLKQATQICIGHGDAWYYRSIIERKQGKTQLADMSLSKAKMFGSEGAAQRVDPSASAPPAAANPLAPVRKKYALLVGIAAFRDSRVPPLRFTAKDAEDMSALLTSPDYGRFQESNVHVLTNDRATTVNIKSELNWLARSAAPDDLVLIYLSSHGSPREMDTAGVNYVVTYDTDLSSPDSLYATSLPMIDLGDAVRTRIRAGRVIVFLDTCYSGAAVPGSRDLRLEAGFGVSPESLESLKQGAGRVIITASSAREKSWEHDSFKNGIFTYFLLDAMKARSGLAPIEEIFESMKHKVTATVQREKNASQVPTIHVSDTGSRIIIGVPEAH